ncbi:hypothetical protein F5Y10DRAFT_285014 [Nemania abortiva]|nr:hypothetical protein F5Y10DRAFT_285014 [Nemania abortiva]
MDSISKPTAPLKLILEAWSQGFMIGALVIMIGITLANMRKGVLLHKLILIELVLGVPNGFFIFFGPPVRGWYLSSTVILLVLSWNLHNIIAWIKTKPFIERRSSHIYVLSILLVQPYWALEIYANFSYFNSSKDYLYSATRPYTAFFRDPWWIFTILNLFWNIKYRYNLGFVEIVRVCPRFAILLACMCLSIVCIIIDIVSVIPAVPIGPINPFWKFAFIFKCFTDSIVLDDFKTALDKLSKHSMRQISLETAQVGSFDNVPRNQTLELPDIGSLCTPPQAAISPACEEDRRYGG